MAAVVIGVGVALGSVACQRSITWLTWLVTSRSDYAMGGGSRAVIVLLLAPVLTGAVYGPLSAWLAPGVRGLAVPDVLDAMQRRGGRIELRIGLVRMLTSTLCIGGGGSVGREGPTVFFGAAVGSAYARRAGLSPSELRLALGCGAAAATAATFDVALSGVVLALELILRSFSLLSCAVLTLSSLTALGVRRLLLPDFTLGPVAGTGSVGPLSASTIGILAALVGFALTGALYGMQRLVDRCWRGPAWLRPAVGGLLLGPLLVAAPPLYGTGYPAISQALGGGFPLGVLAALLVAKILAMSLTLAFGGSGGIFAPALFAGTMLGGAYGILTGQETGSCAVVGAAAVVAGAARIPITAVFLAVELTGQDGLVIPAAVAAAVAAVLGRMLSSDTIFTAKFRQRPAPPRGASGGGRGG